MIHVGTELTSVPRAYYPSFWTDHTFCQRGTKVGTVGIESMDLVLNLDDHNLAALDAFDLCFLLVAVFEVRESGDVLELEFLSHSERCYGEVSVLYRLGEYRSASTRSGNACSRTGTRRRES